MTNFSEAVLQERSLWLPARCQSLLLGNEQIQQAREGDDLYCLLKLLLRSSSYIDIFISTVFMVKNSILFYVVPRLVIVRN